VKSEEKTPEKLSDAERRWRNRQHKRGLPTERAMQCKVCQRIGGTLLALVAGGYICRECLRKMGKQGK
jgi:ribosomal protein S14